MSLESSRTNYDRAELLESGLDSDPIVQLRAWLEFAYQSEGIVEPNAMCVATVGEDDRPSNRMVLLRGIDERGLIFYTSYLSRKGRELTGRSGIAATFYWGLLERQVRIEGDATELGQDESDAYFATRPRGHRLSAWASEQSEPIDRRETLDERMVHFDGRFEDDEVPRPHSWGGYLIVPRRIEFWQGRPNRMHDRLEYWREGLTWSLRRLQP